MLRSIIKKLNNFKFTSLIAAIISAVAVVYGILSFGFFHYAGDLLENELYIREVGFYNSPNGGLLSFLTYIFTLGTIICGIIVAYVSFPYIMNKEKLVPKKSTMMTAFIGGIFNLGLVILMIALIGTNPNTKTGLLVSLPFGILTSIGSLLCLFPFISCNFYMPEIKR